MQSEQDPNFTRQKVNWVDLEEDSDQEKAHSGQHKSKPAQSNPTQANQDIKKPLNAQKEKKEKKSPVQKEKQAGKNIFACVDLDVDDGNEEEASKAEKAPKKDNALSDLLKVNKKPEAIQPKPQKLSKKEQKKKELEELDKILGEMGLKPTAEEQHETNIENAKPVSEGEALTKKKKKKEKEEKKTEEESKTKEKTSSLEKKKPETNEEPVPLNKEQALKEALKKHTEKKKEGGKLNLESAKHEILARQEKAKKKAKPKKTFEDQ